MNDRGFTLIEVLVALTIIAIGITGVSGVYGTVTRASHMTQVLAATSAAVKSRMSELEVEVSESGTLSETKGDFGESLPGWTWEASTEETTPTNAQALTKLTMTIRSGSDKDKAENGRVFYAYVYREQ